MESTRSSSQTTGVWYSKENDNGQICGSNSASDRHNPELTEQYEL